MPKIPVLKNYINVKWKSSSSGDIFDNINPANSREVAGRFQQSTCKDVDEAVEAAAAALPKWKNTPAPQRGEILFRVAEMLVKRKEQLAQDMTREMGKIIKETRGDVQEAIDMAYYTAGEGRRLLGETVPSELNNKFNSQYACQLESWLRSLHGTFPWRFHHGN